jgi:hypothetical protein
MMEWSFNEILVLTPWFAGFVWPLSLDYTEGLVKIVRLVCALIGYLDQACFFEPVNALDMGPGPLFEFRTLLRGTST